MKHLLLAILLAAFAPCAQADEDTEIYTMPEGVDQTHGFVRAPTAEPEEKVPESKIADSTQSETPQVAAADVEDFEKELALTSSEVSTYRTTAASPELSPVLDPQVEKSFRIKLKNSKR